MRCITARLIDLVFFAKTTTIGSADLRCAAKSVGQELIPVAIRLGKWHEDFADEWFGAECQRRSNEDCQRLAAEKGIPAEAGDCGGVVRVPEADPAQK